MRYRRSSTPELQEKRDLLRPFFEFERDRRTGPTNDRIIKGLIKAGYYTRKETHDQARRLEIDVMINAYRQRFKGRKENR